jgi:Ras homolog enriched in brain
MGIHGYVFVFSLTVRRSFDMLRVINEKLLNAVGYDRIPRVIVGNKSDLVHERQVTSEEAQKLAEEWNCPYVVSARCVNGV